MKIDKNELAKKIGQLKGIVPSKTTSEALRGVLYKDGYLIASNTELTVKAKLEAEESNPDGRFIIPEKAFDLISNMPNGIIELIPTEGQLTIKMDKIKNVYNTVSPDEYTYQRRLEAELSNVQAKKTRAIEALTKLHIEKQKLEGDTAVNDVVKSWTEQVLKNRRNRNGQ